MLQTPSRINKKKATARYIVGKLQRNEDKKNIKGRLGHLTSTKTAPTEKRKNGKKEHVSGKTWRNGNPCSCWWECKTV